MSIVRTTPYESTTDVVMSETFGEPCGLWHAMHLMFVPDDGAGVDTSCGVPVNLETMSPPATTEPGP